MMNGLMRSRARLALPTVAVALVLMCGCGDDDEGGAAAISNVAGGPSNTPPPSGVVSVVGAWTGTFTFQQNGVQYPSNLTATMRQNDASVEGTITFTSPSFAGWTATFVGQLSGNAPTSQFFGNITFSATPVSGGGSCTGTAQVTGATRGNSLRWDAPTFRLVPTGSGGGSTVCMGDVFGLVVVLNR
jgi:hypothetical protein